MSMTEESTKTKVESAGESSDVENGNCSSSGSGGDTKKTCVDCGTSRTPLWRGGPAGPKSLCNACGIKSRKKRQAALGIRQEDTKIKNKTSNKVELALDTRTVNKIARAESALVKMTATVRNKIKAEPESKKSLKRGGSRFLDLGFKVPAMKRSTVGRSAVERPTKRVWRKGGEEERAAWLLMALSCG